MPCHEHWHQKNKQKQKQHPKSPKTNYLRRKPSLQKAICKGFAAYYASIQIKLWEKNSNYTKISENVMEIDGLGLSL